jgi:hypothetical protein
MISVCIYKYVYIYLYMCTYRQLHAYFIFVHEYMYSNSFYKCIYVCTGSARTAAAASGGNVIVQRLEKFYAKHIKECLLGAYVCILIYIYVYVFINIQK